MSHVYDRVKITTLLSLSQQNTLYNNKEENKFILSLNKSSTWQRGTLYQQHCLIVYQLKLFLA
jgi:hypothetical protein